MNFGLTEEQEVLRTVARRFIDERAPMSVVRGIMESPGAFDEDGLGQHRGSGLARSDRSRGVWRRGPGLGRPRRALGGDGPGAAACAPHLHVACRGGDRGVRFR